MYAVGKVGSLISRSMLTVSGTLHPFGGAVDIVVVQQQDGSFKSSPWYVRFGKFQGVLKAREKVVNISVNGVEAGFHMYLGSNGEAFFLRDADPNIEEGEFVVSPASSGDEREVPMQDALLRKSKSTSCDSSTMEDNVGGGKILTRTSSRRTTILERMFGRKSIKDSAHAVDRVSSLERAEIAAELLDTKWSTNLSRGSRTRTSNDDEPSKSNVTDAVSGNQVETSKMALQEFSSDDKKTARSSCDSVVSNFDGPHGGINFSGGENYHYIKTTNVREDATGIYTHDTGDLTDGITSTTDQPASESMPNDLGGDKRMNESFDTQGELLGDFEDVTGREMHKMGVLSLGIFEIHDIETDISNSKSEVVSQFVTINSDRADHSSIDTNSPCYDIVDVPSENHDVSLTSAQDACQEKVVIISSSETVETSYNVSGVLSDKVFDTADISPPDGVELKECSTVSTEKIEQLLFEERPLSYYSASSNKEDMGNLVFENKDVIVSEDSCSEISQANGPDKDIYLGTVVNNHVVYSPHGSDINMSVDTVAKEHSTHSAHDLAYQHDLVFPDASSVAEILSYAPENDSEEVSKDSSVENKTCNEELDVSVIQISTVGYETIECSYESANFANEVELEGSQMISELSSLNKVGADNTKLEDDNRASSVVPEAVNEPREEADVAVTFSEYVEEIQFEFSDTEIFADGKIMDGIIADKATRAGEQYQPDCDAEEQEGPGPETDLEDFSNSSRLESSPVPIPGSELQSAYNNLEAKSLPNLRSHIHDLKRSDSCQLSRSLQSSGENNGFDHVKKMNSGFPEQELEGTGDSEENIGLPEVTNSALPENKHANDLKVDSFNPFVELSLCRHLLSEGMGVDAACKAFDAEKLTLENFHAMKQSLIRNNKLVVRIAGRYFPWDAAAPIVLGAVSFREEQVFEPQGMIKVEQVEPSAAQGGSWRIWPFSFRRTNTLKTVQSVRENSGESPVSTSVEEFNRERNKPRAKRMERKVQSLSPTSEELASLDLREGRNVITFTFSTAMLGRQQVDAHIYLWKWNTRIVISDVDGTITKSDVLGQFMPMVGVDWSQNGVAHLFSAIKENGYQLLFLSARSISQAHLTRQFLFNLKQDGKALPDGPVVISPDGLFPSLYREVIRRAPHEFKISCLETIKALFPPDTNPFYAGFGNRDTDEFSYLKVGIPIGKIFIINPKGEVAVNRRVDTKSYTSLHALVNGMFPPISSSSEQEDYNTWNYWKMPLPAVDI